MLGKAAKINKTDAAIEDIFDNQFYLDCVNEAYRFAIQNADLPDDGSDMITKRVEAVLVQRYGLSGLDKRCVLPVILQRFDTWKKPSDLPKGTLAKAEKLFKAINGAFGSVQS